MGEKNTKWVLINSHTNEYVENLINFYKEDKLKARVFFHENTKRNFLKRRVVYFEDDNGDFSIILFKTQFGITVNSKIYSRESKELSIIYKNKKFYFGDSKKLVQLTVNGVNRFYSHTETMPIIKILVKKFSWLRFVFENKVLHSTSFNTFVNNKLYNLNDSLRFLFKVPLPVIKVFMNNNKNLTYDYHTEAREIIKIFKSYRPYLTNIESMHDGLFVDGLFYDTCNMAKTLGRVVNCKWGRNRLKVEHDKMAREITLIKISCNKLKDLTINRAYIDFAEFSGYKLLTTNFDLYYEGMRQHHCVATYISYVNRGRSGIYHINGYTLELQFGLRYVTCERNMESKTIDETNKLRISQFKGLFNESAPDELYDEVNDMVKRFNERTELIGVKYESGISDDWAIELQPVRNNILDVNEIF